MPNHYAEIHPVLPLVFFADADQLVTVMRDALKLKVIVNRLTTKYERANSEIIELKAAVSNLGKQLEHRKADVNLSYQLLHTFT